MSEHAPRIRLSRISMLHYTKLLFRSILFLVALILYLVVGGDTFLTSGLASVPLLRGFIWLFFVVEMVLRFFPSSFESMGCQKQFARNYRPTGKTGKLQTGKAVAAIIAAWTALNGLIGILYWIGILDQGILLLVSLAYSVCDMICILFFCPFQTWFLKNKCCTTCRIYNWDYAMMFTPFVFIRSGYTWSLLGIALALLVYWEIVVRQHPERFLESCNQSLSCSMCQEKLCHHKKQLIRLRKRLLKEKTNH